MSIKYVEVIMRCIIPFDTDSFDQSLEECAGDWETLLIDGTLSIDDLQCEGQNFTFKVKPLVESGN
jgi:hypothetical protein